MATGAAIEPIILQAAGGTQPYSWSLVTGSTAGVLPPGLALAADGRITGTPTTAQMARSFTVRVTDAGNATVQKAFTIAVGTDSPRISTAAMSGARVGEAYSHTFQVLQGKTPYTWSTNSTLPTGLALNPTTGVISGTPDSTTVNSTASFRDYPIALRLTASGNATTTANFTLTVAKPMQWVTPPNLPVQFAGPNCTIGLSVSGGKAPYQFTLASGSTLPPGITLGNATGILSGKPSAVGNYSFTINARDSVGSTISRAFAIQFIPYTLTISGPASASGTQYSSATPLQFSAIGGAEPYRYSAANLPAGLTLNATSGLITGNFNGTAGTTNFTVTVTDNKAMTANATCAYTITAGPVLKWTIDPALPAGKVPDAYSATLPAASGGWAPYTYTVNASTIPVGLTFNATARRLSGTPKTSGNFAVVLTVRDSATPPNVVNATLANSTSPTIPLSIAAYAMTINGTSSLSVNQYAALAATPFTVSGGVAPYTWSTASALPTALTLTTTGANGTAATLSGNATAAPGNYTIGVKVTDKLGFSITSNVTLTISPLQITWGTQPLLPSGKVASAYTTNLTVSGGRLGYTYVLKNGSVLPAGLTLNATTGLITGTPTKESVGVNPSLSGIVTTLAGSGSAAFADGQGTAASFNQHTGVAVDASGNVYSADWSNNRIRKISPSGNVTTLAGSGSAGYVDGQGAAASFYFPNGVAVDLGGNVYVTDSGNNRIRKISPSGHVTTLAGSGNASFADGQGTEASFNAPSGVAVDASGNVYVADRSNHRIRKISSSGNVTTLAGSGSPGFADGQGGAAIFNFPRGVAVDADGNVYVSDRDNQRIRKISLSGNVTTLAGSGTAGFANGQGAMASFNSPREVAVDSSGNVYVAEGNNHRIRKITPSGNVTTLAGSGVSGYTDGQGTAASFASPQGVAVDAIGNAYVADTGNNRIRKITTGLSADTFTIIASDSASPVKNTAEREFTLPIASYGMAVGGPDSASSAQYSSLSPAQFTVSGGEATYKWSATGLPATLSINATSGLVSGNLTAAPGNYTANITVTDNRSQTATKNYTVTVSALPIAWSTNATLPAGKVADAYSTNLTVSSGRAPYTFALSNSTLPAGLSLNAATGVISGTPTTAGNYTFTINASDSAVPKNTISRTFTLVVAPYGMAISGLANLSGQQYTAISSTQFTASGGAGNYTWSTVPSPAVPAALGINSTTGLLSGNLIAAPGNYTLGVKVTDKIGQSVTTNLTITILPGTPLAWVTAANLPNSKVASPYSVTLQSTGGLRNYSYSLKTGSALPPGLKLETYTLQLLVDPPISGPPTTEIQGTPTTAGTYMFTLVARDSLGNTTEREFTLVVEPYGMTVSGNAVISGKQFTAITPVQLAAPGGTANYTWSSSPAPIVPASLTLNATTGLLSGNLTANPGNYTFAVAVRDGRNQTATRNLTVSILPVDPINWTTNATLPPGKVADNYSANLTVKDGTPPYSFAIKSGSTLPGNLTLNATGVLRGIPATAGNFTFTLVARDSGNATAERAFTLAVAPYGMAITNEPPITGQMNQAFAYAFQVANGTPAYTWNATGAPTGLTMNATTGVLSGTPTASGNFATTVRVTDGKSQAVSRNYTISISATAPLSISTPPNLGTIDISKGYTTALQAVGGRPPYTWTINGTKPASVNLAANGTLTANSSTALTANFTVRVQDSSTPAANATQVMTLTYRNPAQLTVATSSLPQGRVNAEYSQQLAATGGASPYQWAITAGTLPAGMVFSPTGWLTGTPTATANTTLTFEVTDSAAAKSTRQLQLVIGSAAGNATASGKLFTDVTSVANLPEHYIIAVEDFDNDGREDLLATNAAGSVVLLANAGAFDFRDITANAGLTDAQPALVADFNNDGVSDILSVNLQRSEATLFLNNGQGVFTKQPLTGLLTGDLANYRDISFADVDGDGDLDLLFNINAASGGAVVAVFNQANVSQKSAPLFSGKSYLVKTTWKNAKFSVTDANADGKPDLVVLQTNGAWPTDTHRSNPASLYLNTGNATADYANATGAKTLAGFTIKPNSGIAAGNEMSAFTSFDIDNDGDLDLINGSSDWPSASVPRIYINDGTGTYTQKNSPILHGSYYHHGATIFDADLDGDQDAVWTSLHVFKDVYPRMWENGATYLKATANGTVDPAKAFYDATTDWGVTAKIAGSGNMGSAGYTADLDGDGDLDFVTNLWSNTTTYKIYRNDANLRQANWLKVELIGAVSPAQGTGARVEVELKDANAKKPSQVTGASRYEIVTGNFTWTQAKADAEARGGHLATFASISEWNIAKVTLNSLPKTVEVWLGATDSVNEGDWKWIDGTPWTFSQWSYPNPNNDSNQDVLDTSFDSTQDDWRWDDDWNESFYGGVRKLQYYLLEEDNPYLATTTKLAQYLGSDIGSATNSSLTFGLADKTQAAKVTVYWPSGLKSVLENVDGNRTIQIREADELPLPRPTDEGDVIAWGANPNGETTVPTTLGKAVQIAAGDSSSAALLANGTVSVWGTNWAAQRIVPATLGNVVQIAAGNNHYLALTANGSVVAWGWNTTNQTVVPTTIKRAKFIAAGFNSSYALLGDERIVAWGANDVGQLNVPAGLSGVTTLSAGRGHVLALNKDGTVVAWGRNDVGQATVPAGLTNVVQIAAGDYHSLALKSNGTVVAWGANWISQSTVPAGLGNVVQISAKGDRSLALKADNSIVSWGLNADNIAPPPAPGTMLGISAGSKHSLGLVRKIQIALTGDLPVLKENQPLSDFGFTATGGSGNYTWSVVGTKPDWLTLNATTGLLSGTPTTAGNQTVTVRVSSGGRWSDIALTFEIQKAIPTALWVSTTGNNTTGDGSISKPFATITKAHSVANRGDVIKVLPGNYTESVVIEKSIEISSTAGPAKTTIRSAGLASAVYCKGAGVKGGKLIGFTLTGGGGANNSGNNRYGGGFAINAPAGTTYEVKNCIISDNNNAGITFGGGLHATGGTTLSLTNSLIKNNAAWASGGAALIEGANLIADRCTIVSNTNNGFNRIGGISAAGNCNIQIKNSILWSNATNQYGSFSSGPGGNATFTFSYSDIQGGTTATIGGNTKTIVVVGPGNINSDPKFAETTNYSLGTGSPAINTGDPSAKDADGSRADIGWDSAAASAGADSDGDGISDALEEKDGTNPNDPTSFDSLSRGLVAYYPFNGNANDESGNGNHATNYAGVFTNDRSFVSTKAISLNGTAFLKATSVKSIPLGSSPRSLSIWAKSVDGLKHNNAGHLANWGESNSGRAFGAMLFLENKWWGYGHDHPFYDTNSGVIADTNWNHIIVTYESGKMSIFVNGKLSAQRSMILNTIGNDFLIGVRPDVSWDNFFRGSIDDVRIYNRALTAAEVAQLYSKESGQPNTVLVQGGTLPAGSALAGQAVAPFQIARFETTWAEWKAVRTWALANGYTFDNNGTGLTDAHPVANVSWYDVVKWCNAKSQMEGFLPVYTLNGTAYKQGQANPTASASSNGYRLPLEKEWEFAARGGVNTNNYTYSGGNNIEEVAWYLGNSNSTSAPVGGKKPNELGIYDMSGNVEEWCWDTGSYGFDKRVKGGNYLDPAERCDFETGHGGGPDYRFGHFGFRYARNAIGNMVTVQGGTLPQGSALAGQSVQAFQIGKYEVTWGEWKTVRDWAAANGYSDLANAGARSGDDHPVHSVSWYDVVKWSNAKSEMEGLVPVYTLNGTVYKTGQSVPTQNASASGYRLPMEAEWEWTARGGVSSQGYTYSGSNDINTVAWYSGNSPGGTKAVGMKAPNELGVFDMSGNVWEWCWDQAYNHFNVLGRAARGGSFVWNASDVIISRRDADLPQDNIAGDNGFRLARNIGPKISISGTMPEPTLNQAYAGYTFTANGATGTPVWSVSSGSLPPGMSFNATTATLSGTPTTAGNYTFTIKVASGGYSDELALTFQVKTLAPPVVTAGTINGQIGVALTANITATNNPTNYSVASGALPAGLTLNATSGLISGMPTASGNGIVVGITASNAGGNGTANWTFNISKLSQTISGLASSLTKTYGDAVFGLNATSSANLTVTYSSSNTAVATISGGNVTLVAPGNTTITASQAGNANYAAASSLLLLTVNKKALTVTNAAVTSKSYDGSTSATITGNLSGVVGSDVITFTGTGTFADSNVGNGKAVTPECVIGGTNALRYSITQPTNLTGNITAATVTVTAATASKIKGQADPVFYYTTNPYTLAGGSGFSGSLSRDVGENAGTYAITKGTLSAGSNYAITFVGANFTIKLPSQTITFPAIDSKTFGDEAFTLNATASSGLPVSYISSNSSIASVSSNGVVTITGVGIATITASQSGNSNFAAATNATQTLAVKPLISASGMTAEAILNQAYTGYTFTASGSNSTKTWSISSGNLPPGMTLNATAGTLSGTPTVSGDYGFTVSVSCAGTSNEAEVGFSVYESDAVRQALKKYAQMVTVPSGVLPEGSMFVGAGVPIFQIGKYEVTWSEWQRVRNWAVANGYDIGNAGAGKADDHPVQTVTWYDVVKWCNAKSQMETLMPVYRIGNSVYKTGQTIPALDATAGGYRLPAEVEWEWAARGATQSKGYAYSGSDDLNTVGWYDLNSGNSTNVVGTKSPNELRLYDFSGNVFEWCWDGDLYNRRGRGGSWSGNASYCSMTWGGEAHLMASHEGLGLRLARNIGPKISISSTMPVGTLDQPYVGYSFSAGGTTSAKVWSISDGSLPPGMTLNASTGLLSGTPTSPGTYNFVVRVTVDGYSDVVDVEFEIPVPSNYRITNGLRWASRWAGGATNLSEIEYGGGWYLVRNSGANVWRSQDGVNWSSVQVASGITLSELGYADGVWLAVASDSKVYRSINNGVSWTLAGTMPGAGGSLLKTGGLWLALNGKTIYRSSDNGSTWSSVATGASQGLNDMVAGGGVIVAVGYSGEIVTSGNGGASWTRRTSGFTTSLYSIAYGNGRFVAVGDSGVVLTSFDGATWQAPSSGTTQSISNISFGNGMFVRSRGDVSADGVAWTMPQEGSAVAYYDDCIVYGAAGWLSVYYDSISQAVHGPVPYVNYQSGTKQGIVGESLVYQLSSSGANSYSALQLPPGLSLNKNTGLISGFTTKSGTYKSFFYAFSANGCGGYQISHFAIADSSELLIPGLNWTNYWNGGAQGLYEVEFGEGWYVARENQAYVWRTRDGVNWTPTKVAEGISLTELGYADGVWLAVASNSKVYRSNDNGASWMLTGTMPGAGGSLLKVGGVWLAHNGTTIYRSSDNGSTWSSVGTGAAQSLNDMSAGGGVVVAIGNLGEIVTSSNGGVSWTRRTSGIAQSLRSIAYGNGQFVAGGDSGVVLTSFDGVTWQAPSSGTTQRISNISFGNGVFVRSQGDVSADGVAWTMPQGGSAWVDCDDSITFGGAGWISVNYDSVSKTVGGSVPSVWGQNYENQGTVGQSFQFKIQSSGGATAFTAMPLPLGLSLNTITGIISGTPLMAGTYKVYLYGSNSNGYGGYGNALFTIKDPSSLDVSGLKWKSRWVGGEYLNEIEYGGGWYIARANGSDIMRTQDGVNWEAITLDSYSVLSEIAYADGVWLALAYNKAYQSTNNGESWTFAGWLPGSGDSLIKTEGVWLASNGANVYRSINNGASWSTLATGAAQSLNDMTSGSGIIVAVGYSGEIVTSSNGGLNWTRRTSGTDKTLYSIAYGNGRFVAVGERGTVLVSSDGVLWQAPSSGTTETIQSVAFGNGVFVRSRGEVSFDGASWTMPQEGWGYGYYDDAFAYGDNGWMNVSYDQVNQSVGGSVPDVWSQQQLQGIVGQSFHHQLSAYGATSFLAFQLPPGLDLNTATGLISGTPTTAGTYQVFIYAASANGYGGYATSIITISN